MRILLINAAGHRIGGIEVYLEHLMPALREAGHKVAFLHQHPIPAGVASVADEGVRRWDLSLASMESVRADIHRWRPDVVYVQEQIDHSMLEGLARSYPSVWFGHAFAGACVSGSRCWKTPTPVPCERTLGWGCLAHYFPHGCGGRNPVTLWELFRSQRRMQSLLGAFDLRLTHSEYLRQLYLRQGLPAERTRVIPFLVPGHPGERIRVPAAIGDGPLKLLFLGRSDPLKGAPHLLDALPLLACRLNREVGLTLAGEGPERVRWEKHAARVMAQSERVCVEFPGWISNEARTAALSGCDLVVIPSVWPEPFGMTGIEAAWHSVPAVAFDVGGVRAWLEPGSSGELAPANPPTPEGLAEAIARAVENPDHYVRLCQGARERTGCFTAARHLAALREAFDLAMAHHDVAAGRGGVGVER